MGSKLPPYADEEWSSRETLISRPTDVPLYSLRADRKWWMVPLWVHVVLITIYSLVFATATLSTTSRVCPPDLTHSPVAHVVKFHKSAFNGTLLAQNPYKGEPRPELDEAWSALVRNLNLRLTKEELQALDRDSISLHGGGYLGQLSVYHHLHCLKYIRQVIYSDHYDIPQESRGLHIDHCIDDIRQALMCNPDISVVTSDWRPKHREPWPNFNIDHTCVDWSALDNWAATRWFDLYDQKSLVHPQLGISFPLTDGQHEDMVPGEHTHMV